MKITKLLVLHALWLLPLTAGAQELMERQKPVPATMTGFVVSETTEDYYYLYNVDAQAFFTEGNSYGTQTSIGPKGLKVAFTLDPEYPAAFLFNNFSVAKNDWKNCFFDNPNSMFVDLGAQANYRWGVEDNGSTFRLFAASAENGNPGWQEIDQNTQEVKSETPAFQEGKYVGYNVASPNTALSPYLEEGEGHYINWAMVAEDVYNDYASKIDVYLKASELKITLDEALKIGAEVAAQVAVYNNADATLKQLDDANTAAKAAVDKRKKDMVSENYGKATWENPVTVTDMFIVNPMYAGNSTAGWAGDAPALELHDGTYTAEFFNKTFDTNQKISGAKEGVYALTLKGFYRNGGLSPEIFDKYLNGTEPLNTSLYVTVGGRTLSTQLQSIFSEAPEATQNVGTEVPVTSTDVENPKTVFVPNMRQSAQFYFDHGFYNNKVLFSIDENQEFTIGMKKSVSVNNDWIPFTAWGLTYYGKGADAYQNYVNGALKNFSAKTVEEGIIYTEAYLKGYNELITGEHVVTTKAEADAVVAAVGDAEAALNTNIELWKTWQKKVKEVEDKFVNDSQGIYLDFPAIDDLSDYVEAAGEKKEFTWTNEELQAECDRVDAMVKELLEQAKSNLKEGDDVTRFLVNPDFEGDFQRGVDNPAGLSGDYGTAEGWTADKKASGNFAPGPDNKDVNNVYEAWRCWDFDLWQEVKDAPVGVYEIEVQGFVRCEGAGYTKGDLTDERVKNAPVYLYMNSALSHFPDVYSEEPSEETQQAIRDAKDAGKIETWSTDDQTNGITWANSIGGAGICFDAGMYKTSAYGLVAKAGDPLRIGVKSVNMNDHWWCVCDNFKLTYQGFKASVVKPALEKALENLNIGENLVGKSVYSLVEGVKSKASEAMGSNDGKTMFGVLNDVYAAVDTMIRSKSLFSQLSAANNRLNDRIAEYQGVASQQTMDAADALYNKVYNGIDDKSFENADVAGLLSEIDKMVSKLAIPAEADNASDSNPVDMTSVIVNPSYSENLNGWSGTGAGRAEEQYNGGATCAEIFGANFDYYQDLKGLPAGIYKLGVQAFYRAGTTENDYSSFVKNPDSLNYAMIYAMTSDGAVAAHPIKRQASDAQHDGVYSDGAALACDAVMDEEGNVVSEALYVPSNMICASEAFDNYGFYMDNEVIVKVGEDGQLRIGLKKETNIENNWTIWDNWKLTYYGADSKLEPTPSGVEAAVSAENVIKVEYFNAKGIQIGKPAKGMNIVKKTLADGTVKVFKVIVK